MPSYRLPVVTEGVNPASLIQMAVMRTILKHGKIFILLEKIPPGCPVLRWPPEKL